MPMTPDQMEARIRNLDRRTARVEQILPTLATKQDLERFATKQDLERFATKQDLERFATKQDLERFATKQDLERFATKDDLADLRRHMHVLIEDVRGDIRLVAEAIASLGRRGLP